MFETYTRMPFDVQAVQVTLENAEEIAREVGGRVEMIDYPIAGTTAKLPCVQIPGKGDRKGQEIPAPIGHWIVAMSKTYRVYKRQQFEATFEKKIPQELVNYVKSDLEATMGLFNQPMLHETQIDEAPAFIVESRPREYFESLPNQHVFTVGGELESFVKSATFNLDNWVRVINKASQQYDWIGYVEENLGDDLHRVCFTGRNGAHDSVFSYLPNELENLGGFNRNENVRVMKTDDMHAGRVGRVCDRFEIDYIVIRFDDIDLELSYNLKDLETFVSV